MKVSNIDAQIIFSILRNMLLPKGITNLARRNITEFCVKIYRAEGLPPMNTDIITSIKQAFVGDTAPMCDPYVEVSFGGHLVSSHPLGLT